MLIPLRKVCYRYKRPKRPFIELEIVKFPEGLKVEGRSTSAKFNWGPLAFFKPELVPVLLQIEPAHS